jgi:hypothetical protein
MYKNNRLPVFFDVTPYSAVLKAAVLEELAAFILTLP